MGGEVGEVRSAGGGSCRGEGGDVGGRGCGCGRSNGSGGGGN